MSPFASLAEAVLLKKISQDVAFKGHPSVYSYLWPKDRHSGRNYEHFIDGYHERNRRIRQQLSLQPESVAVVMDIRSCYPSIRQSLARRVFTERLDRSSLDRRVRDVALAAVSNILAASQDSGIPIGPELSHLLADLVLREVDTRMYAKFTVNYFRYVDDIVVVCHPDNIEAVISETSEHLARHDLSLNSDKVDHVSVHDWNRYGPNEIEVDEYSFEALIFRLKTYLATKPARMPELSDAFKEAGICIPLDRALENSARLSFRNFLIGAWDDTWTVLKAALSDTPDYLVRYAQEVKRRAKQNIQSLSATDLDGPTLRRWKSQRVRRSANQLLYLCPASEFTDILDQLESWTELHETTTVMQSLGSGKVDALLDLPGPAVAAFASIGRLQGIPEPRIRKGQLSATQIESIAQLMVYGMCSAEVDTDSDEQTRAYLRFCASAPISSRELTDFSYADEIRCLQLNVAGKPLPELMNTRYSDEEALTFEALQLSGAYTRRFGG